MPNTDLAIALNQQGLALLTAGIPQAKFFFDAAIQAEPSLANAHANLGVARFMAGQFEPAVQALEAALIHNPSHQEAIVNLSYALWRLKRYDDAIATIGKINPATVQARALLAGLRWETGQVEEAHIQCIRAIKAGDRSISTAEMMVNYCVYVAQDYKKSLRACERLIGLRPNDYRLLYKRAATRLIFDPTDWLEFEERYAWSEDDLSTSGRNDPRAFTSLFGKRWTGTKTGHLLIHREQGFGDVIQFLRYIPEAASRCDKLSLVLPPSLNELARLAFADCPNIEYCSYAPQDFDHYCLIMSLARIIDPISNEAYLKVPDKSFPSTSNRSPMNVGIAWAGGSRLQDDAFRSISFETIKPLFDVPVNWISLQVPLDDDISNYPIQSVLHKPRYLAGVPVGDWTQTAALMGSLDLVISVDTAVAHLAGALGRPVWLLNRFESDWRWGLRGDNSAWYRSMVIVRQPKPGDWNSVICEISTRLNELLRTQ